MGINLRRWSPAEEGETAPLEYMGVDGHSPRRSGAKLLIRVGFGRGTVAFVGRWGSDAIMVYIEEVTIIGTALAIPNEAEPEQGGRAGGVEPPLAPIDIAVTLFLFNIGMIALDAPGTSRCDNVCFFFKLNFSHNKNIA